MAIGGLEQVTIDSGFDGLDDIGLITQMQVVRVRTACGEQGFVEMAVADTGPGLPEKARENLFKPFAGSSRANGTGLGLVIAHELAAALGGELTLQETGETGTAFRLALPGLKP